MNSLNLYYIFYTVAECGNISAAAKKLFISQPAVSKSISKLEESFPSPLLYRTSKGVTLTESGEILYKQLGSAFHAIRQGEEQIMKNEAIGAGRISIGVSTTLCKYVLMPRLKRFIENYPHIKISISCQSTYETLAALENGSIDVGLVGESERLGNLSFTPINRIQDTFVCTREYLEKLEQMEGDSLQNATFLLLNKSNVTRQYVDKFLILHDITTDHQIEVSTMDLLIDFAKIGLGIACVIREFVEEELKNGELIEFPIPTPIPSRQIGFAYSKTSALSHATEKFLELWR